MSVNAYALTSRQRLIDFLGLSTTTATEQNVLDRIVDSVTDFVEHYCQRRFKKTTYTGEVYDGNDKPSLLLKNYPVVSGAAFTLSIRNSTTNENDWSTIDSKDYFVNNDSGIIELAGKREPNGNFRFINYPQMYKVTYTAGYDIDINGTPAKYLQTVGAADLEYAVWKLGSAAWDEFQGEDDVQSERLGDYSVSYTKELFENSELKAILDKYARIDQA